MLKWGIMGAGNIAYVFCNALQFSKTGRAVAVASQTVARRDQFARDFAIATSYDNYDALLADAEVEAIYIATIHPQHVEWAVKAAQAGKHLLIEKPIGLNLAETAAMVEAARANDVFLMEAFMYRCHPQTQKLAELIRGNAIGQVRMIRSVFSYATAFDPAKRSYARELGGGGILDVGCYPASMARLVAGAASNKLFLDPVQVKACGHVGPTGVDHYAAATLQFDNGIIAEIICGVGCQMPVEVSVYGDDGILSVPDPWLPCSPCRTARAPLPPDTSFPSTTIKVWRHGERDPQEISVEADRDLFTYEADMVAAHIADRQAPAMTWDDTLGNMRLLDRWRQEVGVVYPQDA